jgi:hypothetical protein
MLGQDLLAMTVNIIALQQKKHPKMQRKSANTRRAVHALMYTTQDLLMQKTTQKKHIVVASNIKGKALNEACTENIN